LPVSAEQRARLLQAKLTSLVRAHFGTDEIASGGFPSGATATAGRRGWVLIEHATPRSSGGALMWAARAGLDRLDLLVDGSAPTLARLASHIRIPTAVWLVTGTDLVAVRAEPVAPSPAPIAVDTAVLVDAGLEVVVEAGVIRGEVTGLEVARFAGDDGTVLEVGVGRFDREMAALMYAGLSAEDALARVVAEVRAHRRRGAPLHPLRDMCRERWLRSVVVADPSLVDAVELTAVETTLARENLRDPWPAMAAGRDDDGEPLVVVCTYGVDVDLFPLAADTAARLDPTGQAPLVVVAATPLPEAATAVGGLLDRSVRYVIVPAPWGDPDAAVA